MPANRNLSGKGEASMIESGCRLSDHHGLAGGRVSDFDEVKVDVISRTMTKEELI